MAVRIGSEGGRESPRRVRARGLPRGAAAALATGIMAALATGLAGCTKETPFQYQYKAPEVTSKALIDSGAEYLYVPSYHNASYSSSVAQPYTQGDEKLVRFEWSEKSLRLLEIERDPRFRGNPLNDKLVLEIPVEHVAYRCAPDSFGGCTNREEEDKTISWDRMGSFKPDFAKANVVQLQALPIELEKLFGDPKCFTEASSRFVGYDVNERGVNFQVEKTYSVDVECLGLTATLSDTSVSVIQHHSIAKLSRVASPAYRPVAYPDRGEDANAFGFFTTRLSRLDVDNRDVETGETVLMNRWNPDRGVVDYYLSPEFAKAENASIKRATQDAFDRLNEGLAKAGAALRLRLNDPANKKPGEIGTSMIVMVEDPAASGLLGYGPSVADPRTGEILSARVVMYLGTMKKFVRQSYEEIRRKKDLARAQSSAAPSGGSGSGSGSSGSSGSGGGPAPGVSVSAERFVAGRLGGSLELEAFRRSVLAAAQETKPSLANGRARVPAGRGGESIGFGRSALVRQAARSAAFDPRNVTSDGSVLDEIRRQRRGCEFEAENMNFESAVQAGMNLLPGDRLKPWDKLTAAEKQAALDVLVPYVWTPVLVHELGHNMGLRHNFKASEDKENFYSEDELKAMGVDHPIPYASFMDYSYSELNSLRSLGKYDVAALRFGYRREIERNDGTFFKVETTLEDAVKAGQLPIDRTDKKEDRAPNAMRLYGYCTDEHVDVNAGCKRFDEGTTVLELTKHFIRDYYENYGLRNFRNGARIFSLANESDYARRINQTFSNLRLPLETFKRIKNQFRLADLTGDPEKDAQNPWATVPALRDIRDAAVVAGRFFLKVLTESEPICVVKTPRGQLALAELNSEQLGFGRFLRCVDVPLNPGFEVVAQVGRSFASAKAPDSDNPYADQIDRRGIWIDKLTALAKLISRKTGVSNFDDNLESYLEFARADERFDQRISRALAEIAMDDVSYSGPVAIVDAQGRLIESRDAFDDLDADSGGLPAGARALAAIEGVDGQTILAPREALRTSLGDLGSTIRIAMDPAIRRRFGLGDAPTLLQERALTMVGRATPNALDPIASGQFLASFQAYANQPQNGRAEEAVAMTVGGRRYFALPENQLALAAMRNRVAASTLAEFVAEGRTYPGADGKSVDGATKLAEIAEDLAKGVSAAPDDAPQAVRAIYRLPADAVIAFVEGRLHDADYYGRLLSFLPTAP